MITIQTFQKLALSFDEATSAPHFEKTSFRVNKKIFATYDAKNERACIKLSAIDQNVFSAFDKYIIYPLPNKWGKQGWTIIELQTVGIEIFTDALTTAYCEVAPKRLSQKYKPTN